MLADDMAQVNPVDTMMREVSRILMQSVGDVMQMAGRSAWNGVIKVASIPMEGINIGARAFKNRSLKAEVNYRKLVKYTARTNSCLMAADCKFTKSQMKEFAKYAKRLGLPFSAIRKKDPDEKGSFEYQLFYRDKDVEILKVIQAEMLKNKLLRDKQTEALTTDLKSFNENSNQKILEDIKEGKKDASPSFLFEDVLDRITANTKEHSPDKQVIICERMKPANHMEVAYELAEREGHKYLQTRFDLKINGKSQRCSEFDHGQFLHYSGLDGENESDAGRKHWINMKNELKEKGRFSDDLLIFPDKEQYERYASYMKERAEAEEIRNHIGENFVQRKERLTQELGKLNTKDNTDAAMQSVIQNEIRINQQLARASIRSRELSEEALSESNPKRKETLIDEMDRVSKQISDLENELSRLERDADKIAGLMLMRDMQKEAVSRDGKTAGVTVQKTMVKSLWEKGISRQREKTVAALPVGKEIVKTKTPRIRER